MQRSKPDLLKCILGLVMTGETEAAEKEDEHKYKGDTDEENSDDGEEQGTKAGKGRSPMKGAARKCIAGLPKTVCVHRSLWIHLDSCCE